MAGHGFDFIESTFKLYATDVYSNIRLQINTSGIKVSILTSEGRLNNVNSEDEIIDVPESFFLEIIDPEQHISLISAQFNIRKNWISNIDIIEKETKKKFKIFKTIFIISSSIILISLVLFIYFKWNDFRMVFDNRIYIENNQLN